MAAIAGWLQRTVNSYAHLCMSFAWHWVTDGQLYPQPLRVLAVSAGLLTLAWMLLVPVRAAVGLALAAAGFGVALWCASFFLSERGLLSLLPPSVVKFMLKRCGPIVTQNGLSRRPDSIPHAEHEQES